MPETTEPKRPGRKSQYSDEFRAEVLEKVEASTVKDVADELGLTPALIYSWRRSAERRKTNGASATPTNGASVLPGQTTIPEVAAAPEPEPAATNGQARVVADSADIPDPAPRKMPTISSDDIDPLIRAENAMLKKRCAFLAHCLNFTFRELDIDNPVAA